MSQLQGFWKSVSSDLAFQKQLCAAHNYEEVINLILKLGKEQGYNFTYDEAADWIKRDDTVDYEERETNEDWGGVRGWGRFASE